jgi:hypothetical protein
MGHVLMENRHGLVIEAALTRAAGLAERLAAVAPVAGCAGPRPITVGADKGYDTGDFIMELRELGAVPHVAQHTAGRRSAIDGRNTRHHGYQQSQRARHRIEEAFAWIKTVAGQSKTKHRGLERVRWHFTLAAAAYNLNRLSATACNVPCCPDKFLALGIAELDRHRLASCHPRLSPRCKTTLGRNSRSRHSLGQADQVVSRGRQKAQPIRAVPRKLVLAWPATVLIHANASSIRLRALWLAR